MVKTEVDENMNIECKYAGEGRIKLSQKEE